MALKYKSTALFILSGSLLLAAGALGIRQGVHDYGHAQTFLQKLCSIFVELYGVFGLVGLAGLLMRRKWTVPVVALWTLVLTAAAVLAPIAWPEEPVPLFAVALGGLGAFAVGFIVFLSVRKLVRI